MKKLLIFCLLLTINPLYAESNSSDEFASVILSSAGSKEKSEAFVRLKRLPASSSLKAWLRILSESDQVEYKTEAIARISATNDRRSVMQIVAQLDSPYAEVRQAAILSLRNIGDDRIYPKILQMSQSENPVFRVYAAEALGEVYDKRFDQVISEMMKDANKSVRIQVIRIIQKNDIDKMTYLIRSAAQKDDDYEVTVEALKALAALKDDGSIYLFIKSLSSDNQEIRRTAAENIISFQISRASVAVSEQLENETDGEMKNLLIDILLKFKSAGGYRGLEKVALADTSPDLRIRAAYTLGVVRGDRAEAALLKALDDQDFRVRAEACSALGLLGSKSGAKKMVLMVASEKDIYVRSAALYALERIRDKESVVPLFDLYSSEKDPVFRMMMKQVFRNMIDKFL